MAGKRKADGATWAMRVGVALGVVALLQAGNEATRQFGSDYHSAARTAALALVFVVAAFGVRAWQRMNHAEPDGDA